MIQYHNDFKQVRQRKTLEIRLRNRDELLKKKRSIQNADLSEILQNKLIQQKQFVIVDQKLSQQIIKIMQIQFNQSMLDQLFSLIYQSDIMFLHKGIIGIRKIISKNHNPSLRKFLIKNRISRIIQLGYQNQFPQLKLQSALILSIIASNQSKYCQKLVQEGGIQFFMELFQTNHQEIIEHLIWGIGNLAADHTRYRDRILKKGGISKLINTISNPNCQKYILNTIWALSILCRGFPPPNIKYTLQSFPTLCKLIKSGILMNKQQTLSDILWSLANITEWESDLMLLHNSGALGGIIQLSKHQRLQIYTPCLKIIGDVSRRDKNHILLLIDYGIFDLALHFLQNPITNTRKQMCWILSNILSQNDKTIQSFISHDQLLNKIGTMFQQEYQTIQKEICWIYANLTQHPNKSKIIQLYQKYNVMEIFCSLLKNWSLDVIISVLQALEIICQFSQIDKSILRLFLANGGAQCIQDLLYHQNKNIIKLANKIKEGYSQILIQMVD